MSSFILKTQINLPICNYTTLIFGLIAAHQKAKDFPVPFSANLTNIFFLFSFPFRSHKATKHFLIESKLR